MINLSHFYFFFFFIFLQIQNFSKSIVSENNIGAVQIMKTCGKDGSPFMKFIKTSVLLVGDD